MKKTFEVWGEAFYGQGGREALAKFYGKAEAENFVEACRILLGDDVEVTQRYRSDVEDRFRERNGLPALIETHYVRHRTFGYWLVASLDEADPEHKIRGGYEEPCI